MSLRHHYVAFLQSQHHVVDAAHPRGALDDGIEHRLHVRWRAADDAEHFGRSSLMLKRLAQFSIAFLDLFEQSYILDGDDRLRGKGFEERDLLVRERADLDSTNKNYPNGNALA